MSRTYVSHELRRLVRQRAGERCEYCLRPEAVSFVLHEIDHVIAEKHLGRTVLENLALACAVCNQRKGTDLTSIDVESGAITPLYNPRMHSWSDHFQLTDGLIETETDIGRVTIRLLNLNAVHIVEIRRHLAAAGITLTPP